MVQWRWDKALSRDIAVGKLIENMEGIALDAEAVEV